MRGHDPAMRHIEHVLKKATAARDIIDKTRARLLKNKRMPQWLIDELDLAIARLVPVIGELNRQLEQKKMSTRYIWINQDIELEQDSHEALVVLQACGAMTRAEAEYAVSLIETETRYHAIKRGTGWEIV